MEWFQWEHGETSPGLAGRWKDIGETLLSVQWSLAYLLPHGRGKTGKMRPPEGLRTEYTLHGRVSCADGSMAGG